QSPKQPGSAQITNTMNTNPHVIPWYNREQWEKVKAMSIDLDSMGISYEDWLRAAEELAKKEQSPAVTVHKIYLEADKLLAFANRSGRDVTSDTRVAYAIDRFTGA